MPTLEHFYWLAQGMMAVIILELVIAVVVMWCVEPSWEIEEANPILHFESDAVMLSTTDEDNKS